MNIHVSNSVGYSRINTDYANVYVLKLFVPQTILENQFLS